MTVTLTSITKHYRVGSVQVTALNGVTLDIQTGEFVVILGPSGSGKTTLLNLIGGLEAPDGGQLCVDEQDITHLAEPGLMRYRRQQVGLVFQFFNLIPSLTALENVALAAQLVAGRCRDPRQMLEWVGLGDKLDHYPGQLSGGEQQRVAIARALSKNPALVLCDEPTGSLDSHTGRDVLSLMRRLNRENQQTFVVVTHNTSVGAIADRVVRLRDGAVLDVKTNPTPLDPADLDW
jgi:putative ABC transport system ATP-binding protein